jgi:hypothetical protein
MHTLKSKYTTCGPWHCGVDALWLMLCGVHARFPHYGAGKKCVSGDCDAYALVFHLIQTLYV